MENLTYIAFIAGVLFVAFMVLGLIFARLYKRSSKELSYVRTGFGGQKVIMNGGGLVFPIFHEIIPVNMNTLRLEVRRANEQALITKDRMRVDVQAEFYVRVQPTVESIANAAQTLGRRTINPEALKELVEGKFVDALRAVAAEMAMEELHEQRVDFVQKVQAAVSEDILKNGLELESVSLTGLDQTNKEFFNPDNAFDAEGLTKLTQEIEERRKKRNDIEQETEVLIKRKNLDAEQQKFEISRDQEYARLEQERAIQVRAAEQLAQIEQEKADRDREARQAKILAEQKVREADVEKEKQVALAEQARDIAVAEKSREKSVADAEADKARALAVKALEEVTTAQATEVAERDKQIEIIEARKAAEQAAIAITVAAEAEKQAATDQAEAVRIVAEGEAEKIRISAQAESDAEKLKADALEATYRVEAEGKLAVNNAANILSPEQIAMQVKIELIKAMPEIIAQSVKPIENIDGIKILQVDGLGGGAGGGVVGSVAGGASGGGVADQAVAAALRYRSQAPLIDGLMNELGISGGDLGALAAGVIDTSDDAENETDKPKSKK